MADPQDTDTQPSGAQRMFGDFAPALVDYTDTVLFGDVWKRPHLAPRDRSWSPSPACSPPATPINSFTTSATKREDL